MSDPSKISEAEWQVMKALWENSPQTANTIVQQILKTRTWSPRTVRTLINRLVAKGALSYSKDGREYQYSPVLSKDQCVQAETKSFIGKIKGTALTPMLAAFLEEEILTSDEINEIKRMLDQKGGK